MTATTINTTAMTTSNTSVNSSSSNDTTNDELNDQFNTLNNTNNNDSIPTNMNSMGLNSMDSMNHLPCHCRSKVRSRPRARSKQRSSSSTHHKRHHRHHRHHPKQRRSGSRHSQHGHHSHGHGLGYYHHYNNSDHSNYNVNTAAGAMNHHHGSTSASSAPINNLHAHVHLHPNMNATTSHHHPISHSHSHMQLPSMMSVHSYFPSSSSTPQLHTLSSQQQHHHSSYMEYEEEEEYTSNKMSKPKHNHSNLNLHAYNFNHSNNNSSNSSSNFNSSEQYFKLQNVIPRLKNFYYTQCQPKLQQTSKSLFGHNTNHSTSTNSLLHYGANSNHGSNTAKHSSQLKNTMKNSNRSMIRNEQHTTTNQQQQQQDYPNTVLSHEINRNDTTTNNNNNHYRHSNGRSNGRSSATSSPSSLSSSSSNRPSSQSLYSYDTSSLSPPPITTNYNYTNNNNTNHSSSNNNTNTHHNMNPYYYYYYANKQQYQQYQLQQQKYTIQYYIKRYLQIFSILFLMHVLFVHMYNGFHIPNTCHVAQMSKEKLKLLSWIGRDVSYIIIEDDVLPVVDNGGSVRNNEDGMNANSRDTIDLGNERSDGSMSVTNTNTTRHIVHSKKKIASETRQNKEVEIEYSSDGPDGSDNNPKDSTTSIMNSESNTPTNLRKNDTQEFDENQISSLTSQLQQKSKTSSSERSSSTTTTAFESVLTSSEAAKRQKFSPTLSKIIHHQWKDSSIPPIFDKWYKQWKELYPEPEYKHILWTDESARDLIAKHYSWFLPTYDNYDLNIKRADSSRYFILHHMGGIYADLDYEPLINFYDYLPKNQVGLVESPYLYNEKIQNSLMTSPKGDPFWIHVFQGLAQNADMSVLHATGPKFLDMMMDTSKHPVYTLPCENFHRIPYGELNDSKWTAVLVRELVTRIVPMSKHCGYINQENSCQFGKHHNTAGWTSESFF